MGEPDTEQAVDGSQDPLLWGSPTQKTTPLTGTPLTPCTNLELPLRPSPYQYSTTPLSSPSVVREQSSPTISAAAASPERVIYPSQRTQTPDLAHHGGLFAEERDPDVNSLFSSPARRPENDDGSSANDEPVSSQPQMFDPPDVGDPFADDRGDDISPLFSSPGKQSQSAPTSPVSTSMQLDSVPPSPDVSSVASRSISMFMDPSPSPPPTPPPPHEQSEPAQTPPPQDEPIPAAVLEMQEAETSRYSLRQRSAAQKRPFTIEDLRYRNQLKAVPEAIVKLKNLPRGEGQHAPQGENGQGNQDESFVPPPDEEDEERDRASRRKKQPRSADDILNELDESPEERRKRRAREKDEKARKKEARAQLEEERRRRREAKEERKRAKEQKRKEKAERRAIRNQTAATGNSGADTGPSGASPTQDQGTNACYLVVRVFLSDLLGRQTLGIISKTYTAMNNHPTTKDLQALSRLSLRRTAMRWM